MADSEDRLDRAIAAHQARIAEANRHVAEQHWQRRDVDEQNRERRKRWATSVHPSILNAVLSIGHSAAKRGSNILYRMAPPHAALDSARFEVHESGHLEPLASLEFALDEHGRVHARSDVPDRLPSIVPLDEATPRWAEDIATDVIVWVLDHHNPATSKGTASDEAP